MFFHPNQKSFIHPTIAVTVNGVKIKFKRLIILIAWYKNHIKNWNEIPMSTIVSKISRSIGLFILLSHTLPTDIFSFVI